MNIVKDFIDKHAHIPHTDILTNPPDPASVNAGSVIPVREKTTPAAHLSDFPNYERTLHQTQSGAEAKALHEEHRERRRQEGIEGHKLMNEGQDDFSSHGAQEGSRYNTDLYGKALKPQ